MKMNENLYTAHKKLPHKTLACSQCQIRTVHTCKLSQAKTTKRTLIPKGTNSSYPPTPSPKVELYTAVKCSQYLITSHAHGTVMLSKRHSKKRAGPEEREDRIYWMGIGRGWGGREVSNIVRQQKVERPKGDRKI